LTLVYLRVSQINNCAYCLDLHTRDLLKKGQKIEKLALVQTWPEAGNLFDERERAALAWAETVTRVADNGVSDQAYQATRAVFEERELVDLTIAISLTKRVAELGDGEGVARANKVEAIATNQAALSAIVRNSYDYIVIGAGASGAVVAGRLAADKNAHVLVLEAGGSDLKPSTLVTESWFMAQGTEVDWNFEAESAASLNGRAIRQAAGRALGGGTSINGMVWARGHRLDFEHWAAQSGDAAWGYNHVIDIYKRIEDWNGAPDSTRRGSGGPVFVQAAPNPHPIAQALLRSAASFGIPTFPAQNGLLEESKSGGAITSVRISIR
jgi:AhpD family alkylhydroperoxidase